MGTLEKARSQQPEGRRGDEGRRFMRRVTVIGLGYVGLPLVVEASRSGFVCAGLDTNRSVVDSLAAGRSHVDDISDDEVREAVAAGFVATTDPSCIRDSDVVVICVPTPLDEHQVPDLGAVTTAGRMIRDNLREGMLVVLESTTYPGTTDTLLRGILEESGLKAGVDFRLAFSPERIDPGNPQFSLRNTPKVVGGLTPECLRTAVEFYSAIVDTVVPTTGTREAELAKLLENTYRHVNIALVNEMAVFCHELGIDIWAAIEAAKSKPFGFTAFYPGPGVGGHCIPIDPNYLAHQVKSLGYQFRFVELAQEISSRMPAYVTRRVQDLLNDRGVAVSRARVLVLGLTYKPDIADDRETPARAVIRGLRQMSAEVVVHDPLLGQFEVDGHEYSSVDDLGAELASCTIAVVLQGHVDYLRPGALAAAPVVFDTRGILEGPNVVRL